MLTVIDKFSLLKKIPLFKFTPDPLLQELALIIGEQHVLAGELIVKKGDFGDEMFIIAQGKVKVHDGNKLIAELNSSDVFGELAALMPEERIASVSAIEDSLLLKIDNATLYFLMSKNISLTQGIMEVLCLRTRSISKLQHQIIQQEKLASIGLLSSGIAHEIKNPLNFVINLSELSCELMKELIEGFDNGEVSDLKKSLVDVSDLMVKIKSHGKRADEIVNRLLQHAHPGDQELKKISISTLIDQALKLTLFTYSKKVPGINPQVITKYDPHVMPIEVFPQDLIRVFINIIDNACYAMSQMQKNDQNYVPQLQIEIQDHLNEVKIIFIDNGGGILEENIEHIFQPFFTTKPVGEGTGLGLSLSYNIVTEQHQGKLQVLSDHSTFSQFVITLPKKRS